MGTPPTETATGGARSAASPAAAGARSPNPTQLAAAASASRTRIGILQSPRKGLTTKLSSGRRLRELRGPRNRPSGGRLLQRLVRRPPYLLKVECSRQGHPGEAGHQSRPHDRLPRLGSLILLLGDRPHAAAVAIQVAVPRRPARDARILEQPQ